MSPLNKTEEQKPKRPSKSNIAQKKKACHKIEAAKTVSAIRHDTQSPGGYIPQTNAMRVNLDSAEGLINDFLSHIAELHKWNFTRPN